ncbi:MAG: DUF5723 family protein [Gracilimonas sp.]|nr:DUF5723 family protein [Gracilimonas sp.]
MESVAQPVLTPRNMALGGGGSTYITNYNANFYNPANLLIQDKSGNFSFGVGVIGLYLDGTQNYGDLSTQFQNAKNYFELYTPGQTSISGTDQIEIIDSNYPQEATLSDNKFRYDATLIGMKWLKNDRAFSIALRTRTSSRFRVGQGWYSDSFKQTSDDELLLDRSLIHRYQSLHEISFGYAESFQFLTGLTSKLDNFIIGIAPKLIIGTGYQNAEWNNTYRELEGNSATERVQNFTYNATGEFGTSTLSYLRGTPINQANARSFSTTSFNINGIGAGLDIGVTYLLTLGKDLSAIQRDGQPTRRSLRLSFSMTDIGFISYNNDEVSLSSSPDTTLVTNLPTNIAGEAFIGSRGQYISFIEQFGEDNPFTRNSLNQSSFASLLPMALHGGALIEINRLKLMGDVSVGLTNNAFNSTKLISSFGMELRPLNFLPLRGGVQFEAQRPEFLSIGMAVETKKWDLSLAGIFSPNSLIEQPQITGAAAATLQFHF